MKKFISLFILLCLVLFQNTCFAIDEGDITISKEDKILKSTLKKNYSGFHYTITNNSDKRFNILNAQIVNGTSGNTAYNTEEISAGKSVGVMWAILEPAGLFTFCLAWLGGIIATPVVWGIGSFSNKKMKKESLIYTNLVSMGYIEPYEKINVMTLIPLGISPNFKITVSDENNSETKAFFY